MYVLKVVKNENGNEVFAKERQGKGFVYLAKSKDGKVGTVTKNWVLKHKNEIVNLGVSGDSIYPVSADKSVKCSICGEKHKKSTMTPVCNPTTRDYETKLIPTGEFVCSKCAESDNVEKFKQGVITEVLGVPIKKIWKVYNHAIKESQEDWNGQFITYGDDKDPYLEVWLKLYVDEGVKWYSTVKDNSWVTRFPDNHFNNNEVVYIKIATGSSMDLLYQEDSIDPNWEDDEYLEHKGYDFDREEEIEEELTDEDLEEDEKAELFKEKAELLKEKEKILKEKAEDIKKQEEWKQELIEQGRGELDVKDFSDVVSELIEFM